MNEPSSNPSQKRNRIVDARTGWQLAGIFAGAVLLGAIYNSASPLGVRAGRPADVAERKPALSTETSTLPSKPMPPRVGYFNETLAMSLEEPGAGARSVVPRPVAVNSLTWPQVKPLLDAGRIVLVDARLKTTYDLGHIPGAVSLPAGTPPTELQAFAAKYPKNTVFVTYCSSASCHLSRQLAEALMRTGELVNVSDMPGGYAEFLAAQPPPNQAKR